MGRVRRMLTPWVLTLCACAGTLPAGGGTDAGAVVADGGGPQQQVDAGAAVPDGGIPPLDGGALLDGGAEPDAGVDAGYVPPALLAGRPYGLVVPVGAAAGEPLPLVVLLHGFAETAGFLDAYLGMSGLAQEKGFLLALPEGTSTATGQQYWNATDGCCAAGDPVDDVAYLSAVIDDVKARHAVDARRVFVVGHSNGGFMAHRLACDRADAVAAIVSFAGATWADAALCNPARPVAVLEVHGTLDGVVFYLGGVTARGTGPYPSASQTVATWAAKNGCGGAAAHLPGDVDFAADVLFNETQREAYAGCGAGGAAELWSVVGGSHFPVLAGGATELLWSWLSAHARP